MIKFSINTNTAQLPLKLIKGSPKERILKAEKYTEDFFEAITARSGGEDMSLRDIQSVLRKVAGGKIKVSVYEALNRRGISDSSGTMLNEKGEIFGHVLNLSVNDKNKVSMLKAKVFMHEVFHFFDTITNPKYTKRACNILNKHEQFGKPSVIQEFFVNNIQKEGSLDAKKLNAFLFKMPNQKKIDVLQYYRYQIIKEINAYNAANRYAEKASVVLANRKSNPVFVTPKLINSEKFFFDQKLKLIEEALVQTIKKERNLIK